MKDSLNERKFKDEISYLNEENHEWFINKTYTILTFSASLSSSFYGVLREFFLEEGFSIFQNEVLSRSRTINIHKIP